MNNLNLAKQHSLADGQVKKEVVEVPKKSEPISAKLNEIKQDLSGLTANVKEQLEVLP